MKTTRIDFIKSLFAIPLFSFNKEESIDKFLIKKDFNLIGRKVYKNTSCFTKTLSGISGIELSYDSDNIYRIRKYGKIFYAYTEPIFVGKIENISELKQLFKFLEIK